MASDLNFDFKDICNANPIGCAVLTSIGEIVFSNPAFSQRFGSISNICDGLETNDRLRLEAMLGGLAFGTLGNEQKYAIPVETENGEEQRYINLILRRLITDRVLIFLSNDSVRLKCKEILRSNTALAQLIEKSPLPILMTDCQGKVMIWSQACAARFGWSSEEVLGVENPTLAKDQAHEALFLYQELISGRSVCGYETVRYDRYGNAIPVSIWAFTFSQDNGLIQGFAAVLLDISQQKEIESKLKSARIEAERASRAKSTFLATISHEIRTPLTAILGFAELMVEKEQANKCRELEHVMSNAEHLLELVDQVMEISRVEAHELSIKPVKTDLRFMLSECINTLKVQASQKGLDLSFTIKEDLTLMLDATRVKQILINLIGNAIKFTVSGSVYMTVEVEESFLLISVTDTGPGIPKNLQSTIFDSFVKGQEHTPGIGLGLALSFQLAVAMGGSLELINSVDQVGANFLLNIPTQVCSNRHLNKVKKLTSPRLNIPKFSVSGLRILVADDCEDLRMLYASMIKPYGAKIFFATNGREALSKMIESEFDVILMDVNMPELSGIEAVNECRAIGINTPVIYLTADVFPDSPNSDEDQKKYQTYLTKPIGKEMLLQHIVSSVANRNTGNQYH